MTHFYIVPGPDSAKLDTDIAELYKEGFHRDEIAKQVGLSCPAVGHRITTMFRRGILYPRGPKG